MVRTYVLNEAQRSEIEVYIRKRPKVMTSKLRQIRMKAASLDYEQMRSDLDLLERFNNIQVPKGRKSKDVKARMTIRTKKETEIPAKFTAKTPEENK